MTELAGKLLVYPLHVLKAVVMWKGKANTLFKLSHIVWAVPVELLDFYAARAEFDCMRNGLLQCSKTLVSTDWHLRTLHLLSQISVCLTFLRPGCGNLYASLKLKLCQLQNSHRGRKSAGCTASGQTRPGRAYEIWIRVRNLHEHCPPCSSVGSITGIYSLHYTFNCLTCIIQHA